MVQEKIFRSKFYILVLKSTQYVDVNCIKEKQATVLLRNSAKFARNFGIRAGFSFWIKSVKKSQKISPNDCLLKTQDNAKK